MSTKNVKTDHIRKILMAMEKKKSKFVFNNIFATKCKEYTINPVQ